MNCTSKEIVRIYCIYPLDYVSLVLYLLYSMANIKWSHTQNVWLLVCKYCAEYFILSLYFFFNGCFFFSCGPDRRSSTDLGWYAHTKYNRYEIVNFFCTHNLSFCLDYYYLDCNLLIVIEFCQRTLRTHRLQLP